MSDGHLRELERRAKETGGLADEAALLRERVRVGRLTPSALEFAAYLGHRPAVAALGESALCSCLHEQREHTKTYPPAEVQTAYSQTACQKCTACSEFRATGPHDFEAWGERLPHWGREVCVRIALAASEAAMAAWLASGDAPTIECDSCDGRGEAYCSRCHSYGCRGACSKCEGRRQLPNSHPPEAVALQATREWLDIPGEYEERAAMQSIGGVQKEWASLTAMLCYHNMKEETVVDVIRAAVEDAGEQAVRDAIQKLIPSVLG